MPGLPAVVSVWRYAADEGAAFAGAGGGDVVDAFEGNADAGREGAAKIAFNVAVAVDGEPVVQHQSNGEVVVVFLDDLVLVDVGQFFAESAPVGLGVGEEQADDEEGAYHSSVAQDHHVADAAFDGLERGKGQPAGAGLFGGDGDVADLVADEGHGAVAEVRDEYAAHFAGVRGPAVAVDLDDAVVDGHVVAAVLRAFVTDEGGFAAAVVVEYRAVKGGFDGCASEVEEGFGGRESETEADIVNAIVEAMFREGCRRRPRRREGRERSRAAAGRGKRRRRTGTGCARFAGVPGSQTA